MGRSILSFAEKNAKNFCTQTQLGSAGWPAKRIQPVVPAGFANQPTF
jgi:hypothetical protein